MSGKGRKPDAKMLAEQLRRNLKRRKQAQRASTPQSADDQADGKEKAPRLTGGGGHEKTPRA